VKVTLPFVLLGFLPAISIGYLRADLNFDGTVNLNDFAIFSQAWLAEDGNASTPLPNSLSDTTKYGLPYGPARWFSFEHTLTSIDGRQHACFERSSVAYESTGSEVAVDTPRFKKLAVCNPSDGTFKKNEWQGLWSIRPRCTAGNYLIGGKPSLEQIYYSIDGYNWTRTQDRQDVYYPVRGLKNGVLLLCCTVEDVNVVRRSSDLGRNISDVSLDGGPDFSLSEGARISYHSLHEADNGTIIMAEYGTAAEPKIYRSTDNGVSWTTVFTWTDAPDPSINRHFHCVTKQEQLGWWIIAAGDGANRTIFYSTNDGLTWQRMCDYNQYPFQPVHMMPYGNPAGLLFGSDMFYQIGIIEFDHETETVRRIRPVCFDIDRRDPYVWSLFFHEGTFYGGSIHCGGPENHPVIMASSDLEHWVTYARVSEGNGVVDFAGFAGGRIHAIANASTNHYILSPARIRVQDTLTVEPGASNLLSTPDDSSLEADGSGWSVRSPHGISSISVCTTQPWHGSKCLRVRQNAYPNEEMLISTPEVPAVEGTYYSGRVWVRAPDAIVTFVAFFLSAGQSKQVGQYTVAQTGPYWQEVLVPPYQAVVEDSALSLAIKFFGKPDIGKSFTYYVDAAQIQSGIPTSWQVGGTARAGEKTSFDCKTHDEWQNVFTILPEAACFFYDHVAIPCYIKSWVADESANSEDCLELYYRPSERRFYLQRTIDGVRQAPVSVSSAVDFQRNQPIFFVLRCSTAELKLSVHHGVRFEHTIDEPFEQICDAHLVEHYGDRKGQSVLPMRVADDQIYYQTATDEELKRLF